MRRCLQKALKDANERHITVLLDQQIEVVFLQFAILAQFGALTLNTKDQRLPVAKEQRQNNDIDQHRIPRLGLDGIFLNILPIHVQTQRHSRQGRKEDAQRSHPKVIDVAVIVVLIRQIDIDNDGNEFSWKQKNDSLRLGTELKRALPTTEIKFPKISK